MKCAVIFRVDADEKSGLGHLCRSKNLIVEFLKRQISVGLICSWASRENLKIMLSDILDQVQVYYVEKENPASDADQVIQIITSLSAHVVITDSYKIDECWETKVIKHAFLLVIDDALRTHKAHLVLNHRPGLSLCNKNVHENWLVGLDYNLVSSPRVVRYATTQRNRLRVLIHAGGIGNYSSFQNIYANILNEFLKYDVEITVLESSTLSRDALKFLFSKLSGNQGEFKFLERQPDLKDSLWLFDVVVGPAGTITLESLMAGVIPVSFVAYDDGRDDRSSWLELGHALHFQREELEESDATKDIISFLISSLEELVLKIRVALRNIDDQAISRIVNEIIAQSSLSICHAPYELKASTTKNIPSSVYDGKFCSIQGCSFGEAIKFLHARNLRSSRNISTNPDTIVSWIDHVRWWTDTDILKYKIIIEDVAGYCWLKVRKLDQIAVVTTGWFFNEYKPKNLNGLQIFSDILHMFDEVIRNISFNNIMWLAVVRKDNKFAEGINLKFGFEPCDEEELKMVSEILDQDLNDHLRYLKKYYR